MSLWLPGTFGSLAATPQTPGWSVGTVYIHNAESAGGNPLYIEQLVASSTEGSIDHLPPTIELLIAMVAAFTLAFDMIRAVALSPQASLEFLARAQGEINGGLD